MSACGFQPLYTLGKDDSTTASLQQVKVDVIADRPGQILRNYLLESLPSERGGSSKYILSVSLSETSRKLGFRQDKTPRHSEILITAGISLRNNETGKIEYTDTLKSVASFSLGSTADFASYSANVAEESARKNALKILAEDIKRTIATHILQEENKADED